MMQGVRFIRMIGLWCALGLGLTACPGPDFMPVYFPTGESDAPAQPAPPDPDTSAALSCTLQLTASMCVVIEGPNLHAGQDEPLCEEHIAPIPIVIEGNRATLRGALFPDIVVEGHGLPVPITINGRGTTDGQNNQGIGTVTPDGTLTIDGFDFYIDALGAGGRIPDLPLTTGKAPTVAGLPALTGRTIGSDGAVTLVGSTILGSVIPAADKYLKGASMQVKFTGTITPPLAQCSGTAGAPTQFEITKLVVDAAGAEVAVPIPGSNQLEISSGTFIATAPTDIGARFAAHAKFRITNISSATQTIQLPAQKGPFLFSSPGGLNRTVPPHGTLVVHVQFLPTRDTVETPHVVNQLLALGNDTFYLVGTALAPQGTLSVDLLNEQGVVTQAAVQRIDFGTQYVTASPLRGYFSCGQQVCGGTPLPTRCQPCTREGGAQCQLLATTADGLPVDEVNAQCQAEHPGSKEQLHINVTGGTATQYQLLGLRNTGPAPLLINSVQVTESAHSASVRQFVTGAGQLFLGKDFAEAKARAAQWAAQLENGTAPAAAMTLPVTLPPYDPPLTTTQLFVLVAYAPTDLIGTGGAVAGVGTLITDQAALHLETGTGPVTLGLTGKTTIRDIPPLSLYFASGFGLQQRQDGALYAFRGITQATTDLPLPLLAAVPDTATHTVRITGLSITGPDATAFELLDSVEEIAAKPEGVRCSLPTYGPDGSILGVQDNPTPVRLALTGYDMAPGTGRGTLPLLACVNFHRPAGAPVAQRQFRATLLVSAQQLGADKKPLKNPDGSIKQSELHIELLAVVDPMQGPMVFRISQSISSILNTQSPSVNSVPSLDELELQIASGDATEHDRALLMLSALILDPFDEQNTTDEAGVLVNKPNDGITTVFRAIDTRPTADVYTDPLLRGLSNLFFDADAPAGRRGPFFDYPNVPPHTKTPSMRIFTTALSYPGPLAPPDKQPETPSQCETVDPCTAEGQRKFGDGPTEAGKRGTCAFFYVSVGGKNSPSLPLTADDPGDPLAMCTERATPQRLEDFSGQYTLDGAMFFEANLRFWGPTYLHNPHGPLGDKPPLNETWRVAFTTGVLRPPRNNEPNPLPDPRTNLGKREYLLNLSDPSLETPRACPTTIKNRPFGGTLYSSWRYMAPLISKDPEGKIPTGCAEADNHFTGGAAYVHGRPLDPVTGNLTVVAYVKFSANPDLTLVFQDTPMFVALSGWLCDPAGNVDQLEGARCFDLEQNSRDLAAQISIMRETP